jgi:hypothetical protein
METNMPFRNRESNRWQVMSENLSAVYAGGRACIQWETAIIAGHIMSNKTQTSYLKIQ